MNLDIQWKAKAGVGLVADSQGFHVAVSSAATGETRLVPVPAMPVAEGDTAPAPAPLPSEVLTRLRPAIGKGRFRLATAVDSREVFCKRLTLPSADPAEVGQMLGLQIEKWSPLPLEEVVWSHEVLSTEGNTSDVLVVFGKKGSLIQRASEFGEEFMPDVIDVDLMVLWRALRSAKVFEGRNYCALVCAETGANIAKCMILKGSSPLVIEHLPFNATDPGVLSRAMSLHLLGTEATLGISKLDEIFLLVPDEIRAAVGNELGIELGVAVTPLQPAPYLTPASGLAQRALRNGEALVNLLPVDFVEKQQKRLFRQQAKRVGGVVMVVYLILLVVAAVALGWKKYSVNSMEKELVQLRPRYLQAQQLQSQVDFLRKKLVDPRSALENLRVVSESMSEHLSLSHFSYKQRQSLDLRGTAQSADEVYQFVKKLQACGLYGKVTSGNIRSPAGQGATVTFEISCLFDAPAAPPPAPAPKGK